jgi:hypothetical protein
MGRNHRRGDGRGVGLGDLLSPFASSRWWVGAQPQRDVSGLHSLPHHHYQFGVQGVQVRLISELGRGKDRRGVLDVLKPREYTR